MSTTHRSQLNRGFAALSLGLNLALAITLALLWLHPTGRSDQPDPTDAPGSPTPDREQAPPAAHIADHASLVPSSFHWRQLESPDYHQYTGNLRAIGCPERTIRDIIVADIDQLYAGKSKVTSSIPVPWLNADRRRTEERAGAEKRAALRTEKRALVKELIGYEWDNHANEVWHQDFVTGLLLGFLSDDKAPQLLSLVDKYTDLAADIKQAAQDILIEEDEVQLQKLYDALVVEAAQLLTPAERDELELRVQLAGFVPANNIHWDDVSLQGAQLREYVRLSKKFQDTFRDGFLGKEIPEAERAHNTPEFHKALEKLFGPGAYPEYVRAQDSNFREVCEFTKERNLSRKTAIKIYTARDLAETQARQLKADNSLSSEEKATALALLKNTTTTTVSSALGNAYREYLEGPGHWLESLAAEAESSRPNSAP